MELHLIIEAGGGQLLTLLSDSNSFDPLKTIVLTSDPSTNSQLKEQGVANIVNLGARIMSTSWLFHTVITQKLVGIDNEDVSDPLNDLAASSISGTSGYRKKLESSTYELQ
jgi:hypothetical protein